MTTPTPRNPSPIDAIADDYVETIARLSPIDATGMGIAGHERELDDFSPAGADARADAAREVLAKLAAHEPTDETDEVTLAAMRERLGLELQLHEARENLRDLNNIASPLQAVREVFDLMPQSSAEDWDAIAVRMAAVPDALAGYATSLTEGARAGLTPAARQVRLGIEQAQELAGAESFFVSLAAGASDEGTPLPDSLRADLERGAQAAREAYGSLAATLAEIAPSAPEADAVGRERYELFSQVFLGAKIDLDETYEWGLGQLAAIAAEQDALGRTITGRQVDAAQAAKALDDDPHYRLEGTAALREWMQTCADGAIAELNGTHFDIPEPVRTIECMIAPTETGGIYYTPPSDDFSRPGRMWWSVPKGVTTFGTWREKTTVYHEGVPGHHLQNGQAIYRADLLNRWRRLAVWVSGQGEGWALYAEQLMADLGFMDDPGDRFGMLDGQRLRAARVVFDLGVHLGLPCPEQWGGGTWDAAKGSALMLANVNMDPAFVHFEVDRYLGWPGQAPSYKVGQRLWEQARDQAKASAVAKGETFSLKDFHERALNLGSLGLDVLREALS